MTTTQTEFTIEEARKLLTESREYLGTITTGDWSARRDRWLGIFKAVPSREERIDLIKNVVAAHFGIRPQDLSSKSKPDSISWPRTIAMALCRNESIPLRPITHAFNRSHHKSVIHAVETVKWRIETNTTDALTVRAIEQKLKGVIG